MSRKKNAAGFEDGGSNMTRKTLEHPFTHEQRIKIIKLLNGWSDDFSLQIKSYLANFDIYYIWNFMVSKGEHYEVLFSPTGGYCVYPTKFSKLELDHRLLDTFTESLQQIVDFYKNVLMMERPW